MVKYKIGNEDLDKDNLAKVFISKIMEKQDITNKIEALQELSMKLFYISKRETSPDDLEEIKNAKSIIKDNYKVYEEQIDIKIKDLKSKTNAPANAVANPPANPPANAPSIQPANAPANPAGGGSRKKSKKSRS
jgi:hypothetical protein